MLKEYKRKFIMSNLLLVGFVLIVMNVVIFTYSYHTSVEELKTTMLQKLEPYDAIHDILKKHPRAFDDTFKKPPAPPNENKKYERSIFVFFYDTGQKSISVISRAQSEYTDSLKEIAVEIQDSAEAFGTIKNRDLYYYKQQSDNDIKIAIVRKSFIRIAMLKLLCALVLIFISAMLAVLFISRRLAAIAIKPLEASIAREIQFITDISHDLKTPVTAILANTAILTSNKNVLVNDVYKWIEGTKQAAQNMKSLIEQMLVLSRTESERQISFERVNISDIAEQNSLVMESAAYEKNIEYQTNIHKDIYINANKEYVGRIIFSLIENAIKYEADNGKIIISLYTKGKKVYFSVLNQSTVIDKQDIPHIFERFYRSDKSRTSDNGHGLGLAIVKNLVEMINGKIFAESSESNGTVFTVQFAAL